jgi:hypothetical protein
MPVRPRARLGWGSDEAPGRGLENSIFRMREADTLQDEKFSHKKPTP